MAEPSSYMEVPLNNLEILRWKELTVNTEAPQSVLKDSKVTESAGGYGYKDSCKMNTPSSNRFIYWHTNQDVVELVELSLDHNLSGNTVRLHFPDAPVLPGIHIHESRTNVVILISTLTSVHRLVFAHPNKLQRSVPLTTPVTMPSIFADISVAMIQDHSNRQFLSQGGGQVHEPYTSASWVTNEGEAVFALATNVGSILVVKLPPQGIQGIPTVHELRQATMMQRIWTGLVPSVIRGDHEASDAVLSLFIHPLGQDLLIFTICRDHKVRVWSCKNYECVLVHDALESVPNSEDLQNAPARNHMMQKSSDSDANSLLFAVYLGFEDRSQFCVLQPVLQDGQYKLLSVASVFPKNDTLVDFSYSNNQIWAVFTTSEGETAIKYTSIEDGGCSDNGWKPVFLHHMDVSDIPVPPLQDPREAYVQYIFQQSGFSLHAIAKTVSNILKQGVDARLGPSVLKQEVIAAIETEVHAAATGYELPLDEFYQLQLQCWKKFCSNCSQYQEVVGKPVGLLVDHNTGLVGYIKRIGVSVLRPNDSVEHLYLSSDRCEAIDLTLSPLYCDDRQLSKDLLTLGECIRLIKESVSKEMKVGLYYDIYQSEPPENIAQQIANTLFIESSGSSKTNSVQSTASSLLRDLQSHIQSLIEPARALETLLGSIDISEGQPEALSMEESMMDTGLQMICNHLFASEHSTVILSEILQQMSLLRFQLCRDLLVLLYIIQRIGHKVSLSQECLVRLQVELIPKTAMYLQAYHSMYWLCGAQASQPETNTVESSLRQFVALEITESSGINAGHHLESSGGSLIQLFVCGIGGDQVRKSLANSGHISQQSSDSWSAMLLPAISSLARLVWPITSSFLFCEFLLGKCQYSNLQEYCRLLSGWCEWNTSSRQFVLGQCYLNADEPYKAVDCFQLASHGVANEEFLLNKLVQTDEGDTKTLQVIYYLKVLRLLEQFCVPNLVISLAKTALSIANVKDPNIPTLWSKIFKHHLELGHNQEAYVAMTANPDSVRRKDCLRQFIVVLFERSQLQQLCEFPYIDLEDEVVSIVESRARSIDLSTQNYYEFLYAFHVYRGNYRKAGSVMYEFGLRAGRELSGIKGLQKQAKCYLSAINSLHLVDPNYAWIVKPVPVNIDQERRELPGMSPKRNHDGDILEATQFRKHVEVVTLMDLQKEYMLVSARLKLIQVDPDAALITGPFLSAPETVSLLVQAGLFDTAISICSKFKLPYTAVFESLTSRCIKDDKYQMFIFLSNFQNSLRIRLEVFIILKLSSSGNDSDAWTWLSANDTSHLRTTTEIRASELSWRLLESYLRRLDSDGKSGYHKVIASKLLSLGVPLPAWLIHSHKRVNAAELLRLYINFDMLEEAAYLAMEYIDAVLGKGKEYFGLTSCLHGTTPDSVWLPYTALDQLLHAIKESKTESLFQELYHDLNDKLKSYLSTAERVSRDMEDISRKRAKQMMSQ
ncbi:nuclear pore complex protein Nup160-like [Ptychodera flava]|uniref:nuclear pore complex protein Nup160-like n=1 Tax=Ptychodera flava TaxID=63121 RepID=UPI00396A9534